ncbi:MAG: CRISPR-associated endonuclease Cas2 [Desulfobulbaceae bacterium DB1]|nr:MAG: CRISPR-associated endonuclease Cas2 [Desulfobulbaceae bacterium DB1]
MLYLVSYDIPDDRRRTRLAKTLKDFGDRVQFSVFECLLDAAQSAKMRDRIQDIISEAEDSVRIYSLCGGCERAIAIIGQGEVTKNEDVYIL